MTNSYPHMSDIYYGGEVIATLIQTTSTCQPFALYHVRSKATTYYTKIPTPDKVLEDCIADLTSQEKRHIKEYLHLHARGGIKHASH